MHKGPAMNQGDSLYRAVLDDPADDVRRLVYSDWLDDEGQADRAEFVRPQLRLSQAHCAAWLVPPNLWRSDPEEGGCMVLSPPILVPRHLRVWDHLLCWQDPRRECARLVTGIYHGGVGELTRITCGTEVSRHARYQSFADRGREADLLEGALATWNSLPGWADEWWFTRGFVSKVRMSQDAWLERGHAVVQAYPVETVELSDKTPYFDEDGVHRWSWSNAKEFYSRPGGCIPHFIYFLLPGGPAGRWESEKQAIDALSTACLIWARKQKKKPRQSRTGTH